MTQNNQVLPSKEATLFRHLVQNYETKQYKKGLKAADQILRKHPNHGDTQAMKALIMSNQGKNEEAFELCKLALRNAMKSHVCWHVYGLLYRSVKNYDEAIKAYRFALKLDPDNAQIQRDLAILQIQMRDYGGFLQSRNQMLQARSNLRQNWTALAIAMHLMGNLEEAEYVLNTYEGTLKQPPPKTDVEHAEAVLYKNSIIAERGHIERALEHLDLVYKSTLDRTSIMELKASYLLQLGRKTEAEKAYRALLDRNMERRIYYDGLEKSLSLSRGKVEDHNKLVDLYKSYSDKSPRIDAARRIPLDFLTGDAFTRHADDYLRRMFSKGVPSAFANLKQLYSNPAKRNTIQSIAEDCARDGPPAPTSTTSGSANGSYKPDEDKVTLNWELSVNYFLAQHYNYHLSRDLAKAQHFIDKAISLNPSKSDYTYHMTRARIQKNHGDLEQASKYMNEAREMDLKDRYINTKCAKYQLRNNDHQTALDTMGMFTRKEAIGGPLGDLLDMQCVWFITEDGESYLRQGNLGMALKRFRAVYDIFETWTEDQFDFHTFSLRKGMIRAYVDMIRWEDQLREHPFYTRAALSAITIYLLLNDRPELSRAGHLNSDGSSATDAKKAAKKARKETEKAEAERKAAAAKKQASKAEDDGTTKQEDTDPLGLELLKTKKPLEEAMKYLTPLLELSPKNIDAQVAGFEVYTRRKLTMHLEKYLPALKCLLTARSIDADHPTCHEQSSRFKHMIDGALDSLPKQSQEVIQSTFLTHYGSKTVQESNEDYLAAHKNSASCIHSVVRVRHAIAAGSEETKQASARDLQSSLQQSDVSLQEAHKGAQLLRELGLGSDINAQYLDAARKRWPQASVFKA